MPISLGYLDDILGYPTGFLFISDFHQMGYLRFFCYVSPRIGTFGELWDYLANFKNSDFSVLHESTHSVTFWTILWISKIWKFVKRGFFSYFSTIWYIWQFLGLFCKFGKLEFFCISQRIDTLEGVWGHSANFRYLQQFPSFFSEKFLHIDFDEICAKVTV